MAASRCGRTGITSGTSRKLSPYSRAMSQWRDETDLGIYQSGAVKKFGRKRLVMVHETEDLQDAPRFLLTDALHWESGRVMQTWSDRWSCEVFHEVSKQMTGLESAQVRNQEAVNRHFRLSCVAQSIVYRTPCSGAQSERFQFAQGRQTAGQKLHTLTRQALEDLVQFILTQFTQGQTGTQILQILMLG